VVKLFGTWRIPAGADQQEIDRYYLEVHVPNVRRMPKLKRHVFGRAIESEAGSEPGDLRFAECWFATEADLVAAMREVESDDFMKSVVDLSRIVFEVEGEWSPS